MELSVVDFFAVPNGTPQGRRSKVSSISVHASISASLTRLRSRISWVSSYVGSDVVDGKLREDLLQHTGPASGECVSVARSTL
jgi:hypothetical protein